MWDKIWSKLQKFCKENVGSHGHKTKVAPKYLIELTVLMVPIVCSTIFPASPYFACVRVESLVNNLDTIAPATAIGGMLESKTRAKSHPLTNAITKPPKKLEKSSMHLPT